MCYISPYNVCKKINVSFQEWDALMDSDDLVGNVSYTYSIDVLTTSAECLESLDFEDDLNSGCQNVS